MAANTTAATLLTDGAFIISPLYGDKVMGVDVGKSAMGSDLVFQHGGKMLKYQIRPHQNEPEA
jgi:hypothetical protein